MTSDHLFPILESEADSELLVQVGALLSVGNVPDPVLRPSGWGGSQLSANRMEA